MRQVRGTRRCGTPAARHLERRSQQRPTHGTAGMSSWLRWAFGLGGYVLFLLCAGLLATLAGHGQAVLDYGSRLAVMVPLSTTLLIGSMFLCSAVLGGVAFGEARVVILKTVSLTLLVSSLGQLPLDRIVVYALMPPLTFLVWRFGVMFLFDLDFTEARILIFLNWVFNTIVQTVFLHIMIAGLLHGTGSADSGGIRDVLPTPFQQHEGKQK